MGTDLRHDLGRLGERLAADHFERLGYRVLGRNVRTRWGELDLILTDEETIVFCEVKTRRLGCGSPWDTLRGDKQSQVRRIASAWLIRASDRPWYAQLRFDAVGVTVGARGELVRLDHIEGAF